MSITLDIPNNIHEALHIPPAETEKRLKLELAVALYAQKKLSRGKAAELAGLDWFDFNDVLAARDIPMHYGEKELAEDLAYGLAEKSGVKTQDRATILKSLRGAGRNHLKPGQDPIAELIAKREREG